MCNGAIDYGLIEATLAHLCIARAGSDGGGGGGSGRHSGDGGAKPLSECRGLLTDATADPPGSALVFLPVRSWFEG